jgi:acetylcholinesterase
MREAFHAQKILLARRVSFVHNLDPNHSGVKGAVQWPSYKQEKKNIVFKRQRSYIENDDYRADGIAL